MEHYVRGPHCKRPSLGPSVELCVQRLTEADLNTCSLLFFMAVLTSFVSLQHRWSIQATFEEDTCVLGVWFYKRGLWTSLQVPRGLHGPEISMVYASEQNCWFMPYSYHRLPSETTLTTDNPTRGGWACPLIQGPGVLSISQISLFQQTL